MGFPQKIPVRFTEEEAQYISMRPILRQPFTPEELVGMILTTTGKHPERIREILHAGTLVYNMYRYWWDRLDVEPQALAEILARFPDPDPTRAFRPEECAAVLLESGTEPAFAASVHDELRHGLEVSRHPASRKRLFRSRSFWDCLLELARAQSPVYHNYSYARRADLYALPLAPGQIEALAKDAAQLAPRKLRARLGQVVQATRAVFVCPRSR